MLVTGLKTRLEKVEIEHLIRREKGKNGLKTGLERAEIELLIRQERAKNGLETNSRESLAEMILTDMLVTLMMKMIGE